MLIQPTWEQGNVLGLHDLSERGIGTASWMVDVVYTGHDPAKRGGPDYSWWVGQGVSVICRLDDGQGTIPLPQYYDDFAQRCANVIEDSRGCDYWVIGNEFGNRIERPEGQVITTADYISCYLKVWAAVKSVRPSAQLAPAALGPWNTETGDWLQMYKDVLEAVEADWLCWHVYSHGYDPALITSEAMMDPPYQDRHYHFRVHQDWAAWTPASKQGLPVVVTEANGDGPWQATGWIQAAYDEIQTSEMNVLAMCLFRANAGVEWGMTDGAWQEFENVTENGGDMTWKVVHQNNCELGFYDQAGASEVTVPIGTQVVWLQGTEEGKFPRPEMDKKDKQTQSEVFEGRYSASGSYRFAMGRYYLVTDRIYVDPSQLVRGHCAYMHVFDGGTGGARCGIVNGDGPWTEPGARSEDPNDLSTHWGQWQGTYGADALPNRQWVQLDTPALQPLEGFVRLIMQFNVDFAGKSTAGHWDAMIVEQNVEGGTEPPVEPPVVDGVDYDRIQDIIAEELDKLTIIRE